MLNSDREFLRLYGWSDFFESQVSDIAILKDRPADVTGILYFARVICEEKHLYQLQVGLGQKLWAPVSSKMRYDAKERADYPAVGDWVVLEHEPTSERGVIHHILKRKSNVCRKQTMDRADIQILSTNVDYVFITTSINADLSCPRIERYISIVKDAGCTPVILLTKADTRGDDLQEVVDEVRGEFPTVEVHTLRKDQFEQLDIFKSYLREGTTSVFLGSSGVGKSTLVNFLIRDPHIKTQEVREGDDKGRHTTTARNLYVTRYGGLVIDTPGMRELQLSDHSEGVESQFSDVEALIVKCRFSDCKHATEPGCAVRAALAEGSLSEERWSRYVKLESEARMAQKKSEKALIVDDKRAWNKQSLDIRRTGKKGPR